MLSALTRRKTLSSVMSEPSQLGRVLTTWDLIGLSVGSTLGVGVYVLPGIVARDVAGPAVVMSFFYAAVVSVLAGLCFAEFGARVPMSGSAYVYSYVTVGEFVAFIIGWNLIVEYIIAGSSVAKGVSVYLDSLVNNAMSDYFRAICPIDHPLFSEYIDFFALIISVLVCVSLAVGLKESIMLNNLLTTVNCCVVLFVIVLGVFYSDLANWNIPVEDVPVGYGKGGFLPYGLLGTLTGAATCFYGFVGFDIIATSGEESRNPRRAIPIAIIVSLLIVFIAYSGVSSVLTLMWPYFRQDVNAPLPYVFAELDLNWAKWVVTIGGLFGLTASLFGGMFPLPRILYAMSQDGLLFKFLGQVHPKYKTPFVGTIVSGVITGLMAALFSLKNLIDLMSMATLVCYTIVAMSVLILRYRQEGDLIEDGLADLETSLLLGTHIDKPDESKPDPAKPNPAKPAFAHIPLMVYVLTLLCALLAWSLVHMQYLPADSDSGLWPFICVQLAILISLKLVFFRGMAFSTSSITFQMPGVPLTPTLSILFNLYLMFLMELTVWSMFTVWLAAGLLIYFSYGLSNSVENQLRKGSRLSIRDYEEVQ